jgi:hypothetical protein
MQIERVETLRAENARLRERLRLGGVSPQ